MTPPPIVVERYADLPPDQVWPYVADGHLWAKWQGSEVVLEPWPGGEFRMETGDGRVVQGDVRKVVYPHQIVFTWGWVGEHVCPPGSTTVEIELTAVGADRTLIRLTHHDVPSAVRDVHRDGWDLFITRLAESVAEPDAGG